MCAQFRAHIVVECFEVNFHAFSASEFKRRHEIRVACDDDDRADCFTQSQTCNVEADAHVDALLRNVQVKVIIAKLARLFHEFRCDAWLDTPFCVP